MSRTLRYGIVGTGMMGCEHIRNIAALPDAQVVAIADPHEPSRDLALLACGEEAEISVHADVSSMLAEAELDAVVIATPNHTHVDVLDPIFERGLHVLVEKPMCTTIDDCVRVVERAERHRGVFQVGLEYRYMPPVAAFLAAIREGAVGRLRMLFIREHRFPFLPKVDHWNRFTRNTGGTLVEKCCHFFDLMNLAIGSSPVRVMASGAQDVNHLDERYDAGVPDVLDNAFVIVDYANGARACLDLCMFAEGSRHEQELVATGDGGKLECSVPDDGLIRSTRAYRDWSREAIPGDPRVAHTGFHHGASYLEHLDFLDSIRSGQPARVGARDGLRSVAIGVAAHRSIDERRSVELAEFGPIGL